MKHAHKTKAYGIASVIVIQGEPQNFILERTEFANASNDEVGWEVEAKTISAKSMTDQMFKALCKVLFALVGKCIIA